MRIETYVDYVLVEHNNETSRISHDVLRSFLESQEFVQDDIIGGEHVQTAYQVDYFTIVSDEEKLKSLIEDYLQHEPV